MNIDTFNNLKVGDKVRCVNSEGWEESFEEGEVYTVTAAWSPYRKNFNHTPVSFHFTEDFEIIEEAK